jgi:hypothetical protein
MPEGEAARVAGSRQSGTGGRQSRQQSHAVATIARAGVPHR